MKLFPARPLSFYRNLSIRSKLTLILYIQIIIPLILVGYLSYRNSEAIIKEKSAAYSRDILSMIQLRLDEYINNLTVISQDLLYDDKIYEALKSIGGSDERLNQFENASAVESHLKMIVITRKEVRSICILANDGTNYFADDNTSNVSAKDNIPYDKLLALARNSGSKPIWYVDAENRKVHDIYEARLINDRDRFTELGLMIIQVRTEFLDSVYQDLTGNLENIAILSDNNEQIAVRKGNDSYIMSESMLNELHGDKGEMMDRRASTFISYITLENPAWKVVAYVTFDELYKDAYSLRRNIIILSIISVLLLSVLSAFISVDFVNPIKRLVKGMKRVQNGESNVFVKDDRGDELGFLNKTFNEMSGEIQHLVNWVYREQLTRKEAELKALQSQINPHFLFNTLETINWMAQLNNVPEISNTVSDLSDLMEASIGRDDRLISLEQEFTYADKYISLVKKRFNDRIELVKNVQKDLLGIKIPRLLIQPLIENAVYHGLGRSKSKGIINLNAEKRGDGLMVIEVMDNGSGMDKEDLNILNERLSMDNDTYFKRLGEKRNKSIGIENVNRRIKLFYGEEYGLKIESEPGRYTLAEVTIPIGNTKSEEGFYVQSADNRR